MFITAACARDDLELLQEIYESEPEQNKLPHLRHSVQVGSNRIVRWLLTEFSHTDYEIGSLLVDACRYGNLEVAIWIQRKFNVSPVADGGFALLMTACSGQLHILQWLYTFTEVKELIENSSLRNSWDIYFISQIPTPVEEWFLNACRNGHLDVVNWLCSITQVNTHIKNDEAFLEACKYNRVEIVKWLWKKGSIEEIRISQGLRHTLTNRHYPLAVWICMHTKHTPRAMLKELYMSMLKFKYMDEPARVLFFLDDTLDIPNEKFKKLTILSTTVNFIEAYQKLEIS